MAELSGPILLSSGLTSGHREPSAEWGLGHTVNFSARTVALHHVSPASPLPEGKWAGQDNWIGVAGLGVSILPALAKAGALCLI